MLRFFYASNGYFKNPVYRGVYHGVTITQICRLWALVVWAWTQTAGIAVGNGPSLVTVIEESV